jgi:hypothetical protein
MEILGRLVIVGLLFFSIYCAFDLALHFTPRVATNLDQARQYEHESAAMWRWRNGE